MININEQKQNNTEDASRKRFSTMLGGRAKKIDNTNTKVLPNVPNVQGLYIKSAIKIESLIDHKAYLTSFKRKIIIQNTKSQATLAQSNVASLDAKGPRENAQKSSADYSTQARKARWFETRSQLTTRQTFTYDLTVPKKY